MPVERRKHHQCCNDRAPTLAISQDPICIATYDGYSVPCDMCKKPSMPIYMLNTVLNCTDCLEARSYSPCPGFVLITREGEDDLITLCTNYVPSKTVGRKRFLDEFTDLPECKKPKYE